MRHRRLFAVLLVPQQKLSHPELNDREIITVLAVGGLVPGSNALRSLDVNTRIEQLCLLIKRRFFGLRRCDFDLLLLPPGIRY